MGGVAQLCLTAVYQNMQMLGIESTFFILQILHVKTKKIRGIPGTDAGSNFKDVSGRLAVMRTPQT